MASSWNRVHVAAIATDPNYRRGYGGTVSDVPPPEPPPDQGESGPDPAGPPTPVMPEETGYTSGGVPTFDYVREKIETTLGTSTGAAELAEETPEGRRLDEQYEARRQAAADRLAQIRESMKNEGA